MDPGRRDSRDRPRWRVLHRWHPADGGHPAGRGLRGLVRAGGKLDGATGQAVRFEVDGLVRDLESTRWAHASRAGLGASVLRVRGVRRQHDRVVREPHRRATVGAMIDDVSLVQEPADPQLRVGLGTRRRQPRDPALGSSGPGADADGVCPRGGACPARSSPACRPAAPTPPSPSPRRPVSSTSASTRSIGPLAARPRTRFASMSTCPRPAVGARAPAGAGRRFDAGPRLDEHLRGRRADRLTLDVAGALTASGDSAGRPLPLLRRATRQLHPRPAGSECGRGRAPHECVTLTSPGRARGRRAPTRLFAHRVGRTLSVDWAPATTAGTDRLPADVTGAFAGSFHTTTRARGTRRPGGCRPRRRHECLRTSAAARRRSQVP